MRFVVQKPLYPFKTLTNVKDICQVILIVAFGTSHPYFPIASRSHLFSPSVAPRPSWDPPRDLSLSDITYRVIEDKLTDYDLSFGGLLQLPTAPEARGKRPVLHLIWHKSYSGERVPTTYISMISNCSFTLCC